MCSLIDKRIGRYAAFHLLVFTIILQSVQEDQERVKLPGVFQKTVTSQKQNRLWKSAALECFITEMWGTI